MKNMSYAEHVAQTILGQLGSQRFVVMTGAKNLAYFDDAYFHERRSLNNFHRDRVITFEQIAE